MLYLSNGKGGYATFAERAKSRYHGLFWTDQDSMYRILEDIRPAGKQLIKNLNSATTSAIRTWQNGLQEELQYQENTLIYRKNTDCAIELLLDVKRSYDNSEFGRNYSYVIKNNKVIITFEKKADPRDNQTSETYRLYLVIDLQGKMAEFPETWLPADYCDDRQREAFSPARFIYQFLRTNSRQIVMTVHGNVKKAIAENNKIVKAIATRQSVTIFAKDKPNNPWDTASRALSGLLSNMHGRTGLLAGHPWFFQYWTRDEVISAKGLWLAGHPKEAKAILFNAIRNIDDEGRIPNRIPAADLGCADGVGWAFYRLKQLHESCKLSKTEIELIKKQLRLSLEHLEHNLTNEGLITNRPQETWMDTEAYGDVRGGKRIEIQVMTLMMYEFLFALGGEPRIKNKALAMKKRIRQEFWNGKCLQDGSADNRIRPNVFLAYYFTPNLLTKKQWESTFDIALKALWLSWGGLATLDKQDPLFVPNHTGQNNISYHRGDSWYWINNLAAIAMLRLNKKYTQKAEKILRASLKNMTSQGAFGCCSEVSSASKQTAEGCFNQAWSNATLLELLAEQRMNTGSQ